jgi:hypothetical protein
LITGVFSNALEIFMCGRLSNVGVHDRGSENIDPDPNSFEVLQNEAETGGSDFAGQADEDADEDADEECEDT